MKSFLSYSRHVIFSIGAAALVSYLAGCAGDEQQQFDDLLSDMTQKISKASGSIDKIGPATKGARDATLTEVSKLYVWEYLVRDIEEDASAEEANAILSTLGRDRWECYASINTATKTRMFCKRRPETYLKYLTTVIPGLLP